MRIVLLALIIAPFTAQADHVFTKGKGTTWDCAKDPVVNINHGGGKYMFKGACNSININGGEHTVTIESVETIRITGGSNTITVGAVNRITIAGTKNTVIWQRSKQGDGDEAPAISKVGKDNKVSRGT